ncbi:MAG TPA: MFS transporter [Gemmatimonadales bacterium]|nr:MFS transporter [Gemmatimonadales bacterium]
MTPRRVLALLAAAELLAMSPWFSASAVAPALVQHWHLGPRESASLTISVQLGFVFGALVSAIFTLSDLWSPTRLVAVCAWIAGAATLGVILAPGPETAIALRAVTGAALAGVYPPGMKIAAQWFREMRGRAIGILVGALTVGSASPHLVRAFVHGSEWQSVLATAAFAAFAGGVLVLLLPREGPYSTPSPPFSWAAVPQLVRDRAVLLANCGYLGHMWELYAMWTWIAVFIAESEVARKGGRDAAAAGGFPATLAFAVIAAGAVGCWLAGKWADQWGRTRVTSVAMALSGSCAIGSGLVFGKPVAILSAVLLIWGVAVVADSAQFSAAVSELAPREYVGTALTLQTCLGFLLTTATIYLLPVLAARIGWQWSMSVLALGPALGIVAMLTLRGRPEARLMAGGRG